MILSRSAADGLSLPVIDAAEFDDVGITLLDQLFRCLLAAVAAAAVYQDQLLLVRQLRDVLVTDGLVGNIDSAGDMLLAVFLRSPDIQNEITDAVWLFRDNITFSSLVMERLFCHDAT